MKRILAAALLFLCGCAAGADPEPVKEASGDIFAMDTYMTVTCYGERSEEALSAALKEIHRIDTLLSVGEENSEIVQINQEGRGIVSEDTEVILKKAYEVYSRSGGAFDITVYPLMEAWGFTDESYQVPSDEQLNELLQHTGMDRLTYDEQTRQLALNDTAGIDFGGIAKGYTSGRLMEIFAEYDLVSGLVWLGGNVQCYKTKPDGTLWRCGIEDPFAPQSSMLAGILSVEDKAVITSGGYERFFTDEETGTVYHHILDPKTGKPAGSGLVSVTIVSSDGTLADALSTACYVMGREQAEEYWRQYGDDFDMILVTEEKEVYVTEGIAGNFTSDYPVHVIGK